MVRAETFGRHTSACLWQSVEDYTDTGVQKVSSTVVELSVQWELKKGQMVGPSGEDIATDAIAVVDRDINLGSILWLGEADSLPSSLSSLTDLYKVVLMEEALNRKGSRTRRVITLKRYSDSFPPTET